MFYCENCGSELRNGIRFCEECGNPVPEYILSKTSRYDTLTDTIFAQRDWKQIWAQETASAAADGHRIGILLLNTCDCTSSRRFSDTVAEFIAFKKRLGIRWFCLDLNTENVCRGKGKSVIDHVLKVLRAIYTVCMPEYLMILGDTAAVGSAKWENTADRHDKYVTSDLPYLTMDLSSPWNGMQYDFNHMVLTGRVPGSAKNGFAEVCAYLKNYMALDQTSCRIDPFGLSALQWQEVSHDIYRDFGQELLLSPDVVVEQVAANGLSAMNHGTEPNLLYFNLHGSDLENYWYGQRNNWMPRAFSAACLPRRNGYVIGVEACYGAIQMDAKRPSSILMEAMAGGCLAFVGSSTVAFGGVRRGQNCCADVLIHRFLLAVKDGADFGHAFLNGFKALYCSKDMDDATVKTCAQFALYGDPSAALFHSAKSMSPPPAYTARTLSVPMPDVRSAVRMALWKVSADISARLDAHIAQYHSDFQHIKPVSYRMQGTDMYQSMYTKTSDGFVRILKLYYDNNGTVLREYVSH